MITNQQAIEVLREVKSVKTPVFFAMNRDTKRACTLPGFIYWEEVQGAFRCGIQLPDGTLANGIGRCPSEADFRQRASNGGITIL